MLLKLIASHLSSRECCRSQLYRVEIDETGVIRFDPRVQVFHDTYHRKETDRVNVIDHIVMKHLYEMFVCMCPDGSIQVDASMIVPGTYEYQASFDNKRRRWIRTK